MYRTPPPPAPVALPSSLLSLRKFRTLAAFSGFSAAVETTGGMGRGKRKTETRHLHGGRRAKVSPGKSKPHTDLGPEKAEGPGRIEISDVEIASDLSNQCQADRRLQEGTDEEAGEDSDECNRKGIRGDDLGDKDIRDDDSDEGRGPSLYLVVCHWDWSTSCKPYGVYKMTDATQPDASSRSYAGQKRLHRFGSLETEAGGKVFTSVRSRHRAWIVGVGGNTGDTVIFDTKTKDVIRGPTLNSAKWCPVLTAVGDKVYAMSKIPSWLSDPDFPPWFEVLDLSKCRVVTDGDSSHLEDCCWSEVPIPPCMPWKLNPIEYTILPFVNLMSYVVVSHYILVSFNQPWGTHALDTDSHKWHKVDNANLPFFGCAVRHGCIFLALSKKDGPLNAYSLCVTPSGKDNALKLSVNVLPVTYEEHKVDAEPCFTSMDNKYFCSLFVSLDSHSLTLNRDNELYPKKALVNLTIRQIETSKEALLAVKPTIAVSSHWEQNLKISSSHGFSPFAFNLLSI